MTDSTGQRDLERLTELVDQRCNGALGPEGFDELHALVERTPELREAYWEMIGIHVDLCWVVPGRGVSGATPDEPVPVANEQGYYSSTTDRNERRFPRSWQTAAVAAVLLAAVIGGGSLYLSTLGPPAQAVASPESADGLAAIPAESRQPNGTASETATLTPLAPNSRWFFGRPGDQNPRQFRFSETVWVEEGSVELQMGGGTFGELTAPVVLQLLSTNRVRLLRGKAKFRAPERAQGFTVETPSAEVVDLGTVFSVEASSDGTDLVVYDGKVDLRVPDSQGGIGRPLATSKQFSTGQAVRVDMNGTLSRLKQVRSVGSLATPTDPRREPVIESVTDNLSRPDHWAFYEVVVGGMSEDALAFVDRNHEWNGVDESGLPDYLVRGDYVRMFNDDKWVEGFRLDVVLSKPASLYVLLDDRVPPPRWLEEAFVNTGDHVGIDEDRSDRADDDTPVGVGPASSIDLTCSVWRLDKREAGTVVLGPNGKDPTAHGWFRSMYGVVAAPLREGE